MRWAPSPWPRHDVLPAAGLAIAAVRHPLPSVVREHSHEFAEIAVVTAGRGIHRSAAGDQRIATGDVVLLAPGAWHAYAGGRGLAVVDIGIGADVLRRELAWLARDRELGGLGRALAAGTATVLHLPAPAFARADPLCDRLAGASGGAERLGHLLLVLAILAPSLPQPADPPGAVAAAMTLLADDPAQRWSLAGLARRLGRDRSHFARAFRAATGQPPMAWLARLRAERAASLLDAGDLPVAEVGAAVGWADPAHFARRFRQHHGRSPSAYRQRRAAAVT